MSFRAALLTALMLMPGIAACLSLSPTRLEVDLRSQPAAEAELLLGGRPDRAQHIELSVVERLAEGTPVDAPETGVVIDVVPPQLVIEPGQRGRVRVQVRRIGAVAPASRSYYLVVEPVAIAVPETDGAAGAEPQLNFVPRLYLPLHVDLGGTPATRVRRVAGPQAEGEEPGGAIELVNRGNRYQRLGTLRVAGPADALDGRELARRAATDALLPGQTLRIPLAAGELPGEPLTLQAVGE